MSFICQSWGRCPVEDKHSAIIRNAGFQPDSDVSMANRYKILRCPIDYVPIRSLRGQFPQTSWIHPTMNSIIPKSNNPDIIRKETEHIIVCRVLSKRDRRRFINATCEGTDFVEAILDRIIEGLFIIIDRIIKMML
jgi:hypothetical protein